MTRAGAFGLAAYLRAELDKLYAGNVGRCTSPKPSVTRCPPSAVVPAVHRHRARRPSAPGRHPHRGADGGRRQGVTVQVPPAVGEGASGGVGERHHHQRLPARLRVRRRLRVRPRHQHHEPRLRRVPPRLGPRARSTPTGASACAPRRAATWWSTCSPCRATGAGAASSRRRLNGCSTPRHAARRWRPAFPWPSTPVCRTGRRACSPASPWWRRQDRRSRRCSRPPPTVRARPRVERHVQRQRARRPGPRQRRAGGGRRRARVRDRRRRRPRGGGSHGRHRRRGDGSPHRGAAAARHPRAGARPARPRGHRGHRRGC